MRNQETVGNEIFKFRIDLFRRRLSRKHVIGDAVDFGNMPGDGMADLNKTLEFADYLVAFHGDCPDFYNPVPFGRVKSCCFHINKNQSSQSIGTFREYTGVFYSSLFLSTNERPPQQALAYWPEPTEAIHRNSGEDTGISSFLVLP